MLTKDKPVMIWTEDGCWYQQKQNGVQRSSYLGHIGTSFEVAEWCESHGTEFATKFHPFAGTAVAEKWPASLPRHG